MVGEASSGEEGVKLAQELLPDVVLMDLKLPDADGLDLLTTLKGLKLAAAACGDSPFRGRFATISDVRKWLKAHPELRLLVLHGGERHMLFVDIVGFTAMAEAMTPEAVVALLREFHQRMAGAK